MDKLLFVMLLEKRRPFDAAVIARHIAYLRQLDDNGQLVLCDPFTDYPGGMVAIRADNRDSAEAICQSDPFVAEGYETYSIRTLEVATKENGYG